MQLQALFGSRFRIRINDSKERQLAAQAVQRGAGRKYTPIQRDIAPSTREHRHIVFDVPDAADQGVIQALNRNGFRYVFEASRQALGWLNPAGELKVPIADVRDRRYFAKLVQRAARKTAVPQNTETTQAPPKLIFWLPSAVKDRVLQALNKKGAIYDYTEPAKFPGYPGQGVEGSVEPE